MTPQKLPPAIRVELTLATGEVLTRDYHDSGPAWVLDGPPAWLLNPGRVWDRPQDPVTFSGTVEAGHEAEARAVINA